MTEVRKILSKSNAQRQINSVQTSGDTGGKPQTRHKNKDKIPRSLRYDLENALVGLCDVWFEDIKPYLVRNKVKVHVHDGEAGGRDCEAPAPECSHLDPATSAPQCRLCRLLFNASNSIQSAVSQAAVAACVFTQTRSFNGVSDISALLQAPWSRCNCDYTRCNVKNYSNSPCLNCKNEPKKARRKRQKLVQSPKRPLVPRLCRTYCIPPNNTQQPFVNNNNIDVHLLKPLHHNKLGYPLPKPEIMKDASTLTEKRVRVEKKKVKHQFKEIRIERSQSPSVKKDTLKNNVVKTESKKKQPSSLSPQFGRCQATTTFFPQQITIKNPEPALFPDDLINIISEKHTKLKVLYRSPVQEDYPSIMNLYSPTCNLLTPKKKHKSPPPPWR